jgi:hypothetical protein
MSNITRINQCLIQYTLYYLLSENGVYEMDTDASLEIQLRTQIESLRDHFPQTQDLYREVCALLFFRHGITPTANKLYQLVRKGSMSAPAEALGKFWCELREKSRGRIDHPDLPEDLKEIAGDLVSSLWTKAQKIAEESFSSMRADVLAASKECESRCREHEIAQDKALEKLTEVTNSLNVATDRIREMEQQLAGEIATRVALESQLMSAQQASEKQQSAMNDARRDFTSELEKVRSTLKITEDRYQAAENRALLEVDRERTIAAKLQKELELTRIAASNTTERYRLEIGELQVQIGNQRQRIGHFEGELQAAVSIRDQLRSDLNAAHEATRECVSRSESLTREVELWRRKAETALVELEKLRSTQEKKSRKTSKPSSLVEKKRRNPSQSS